MYPIRASLGVSPVTRRRGSVKITYAYLGLADHPILLGRYLSVFAASWAGEHAGLQEEARDTDCKAPLHRPAGGLYTLDSACI